jgi:hypothetical protein
MNESPNPSPDSQAHLEAGAKDQPGAPAAVKDAANYVGLYPLGQSVFAITITETNGVLYGQHTNSMNSKLREIAPDRFAPMKSISPVEIVFERDAAGNVIGLVYRRNDLEQRGPRLKLPQWPKEVTLPIEVLREYVGTYPRAPGIDFKVTEENGKLFTQMISQPNAQIPTGHKLPIFASAHDEFFAKLSDVRFIFERDMAGQVIGFVLHQRMRKLPVDTVKS